jgi:phosphatidylinositol glycan class B
LATGVQTSARRASLPDLSASPRTALALVYALALILRISAAFLPDRTFYPDEHFQLLEQGHRLVFGYGLVPWEFEAGIRNWILPALVGGVIAAATGLGFENPAVWSGLLAAIAIAASLTLVACTRGIADRLAGPRAGLIAAGLVATYGPCVFAAPKLTPETVAGYTLAAAVLFGLGKGRANAFAAGVMAGLTVGFRLHYAPALLVSLVTCWRAHRHPSALAVFVGGGSAAFGLFGLVDWITWGSPFHSYVESFRYNILMGVAARFGVSPPDFFVRAFLFGTALALAAALDIRRNWPVMVPVAAILGVHSLIGHKEPRFVFAMHGLTMVGFATYLSARSRLFAPVLPLVLALNLAFFGREVVDPYNIGRVVKSADAALDAVRRDPAARGLATYAVPWEYVPGYYRLHRPIPLLFNRDLPPAGVVPPDVTHVLVPAFSPAFPDFPTAVRFDLLELRTRPSADPARPAAPPTAGTPFAFDPAIGPVDTWGGPADTELFLRAINALRAGAR